jgi:ATP adenylyltransferase
MLNKYCLYRPMLVLPTKEFALQSEDLDASDLAASWALLNAFPSLASPLIIYNRGVNGGSSQGHKHLQLFPVPASPFGDDGDDDEGDKELWPAKAPSTDIVATNIPHVPFKHFVLRIPDGASAETVIAMHDRLLTLTRQAHVDAGYSSDGDYNVALSRSWIALIPRTTAGPVDGPFGTSTVGMLGLVAIRDEHDRKRWEELGYTEFLAGLGIPIGR